MARMGQNVKFDRKARILSYAVEIFKILPEEERRPYLTKIDEIYRNLMRIIELKEGA